MNSLALFILFAISPVILALVVKGDWVTMKSVLIGFGIGVALVLIAGLILASALNNWQ